MIKALLGGMLLFCMTTSHAISVIVNDSVSFHPSSSQDIRNVFTLKKLYWDNDNKIKIFVKALSDVARALGKKTIAEFVETEETVNILKELQIDYAQGYYISKPLPKID